MIAQVVHPYLQLLVLQVPLEQHEGPCLDFDRQLFLEGKIEVRKSSLSPAVLQEVAASVEKVADKVGA